MSQDTLSDMFVMIKNASRAKHNSVDISLSKVKLEIIKVFKTEGFIKTFKIIEKKAFNYIRIILKYTKSNESVIDNIKRVSKQGCRIYRKAKDIPRILNGLGVVIVSTSSGITTGKKAKEELKLGGEILCYIW